jgi:chromosome segregation ATPase
METIDRLEDERQEILRKKQQDREDRDAIRQERDAIVAELEKYGKEIPSIKRIRELEMELDEKKKLIEDYETGIT